MMGGVLWFTVGYFAGTVVFLGLLVFLAGCVDEDE